ncbi:MAG: hypothetical protein KatS3mg028_0261 [Bacteroidia bacterium]|nr:MAG: hypothetical protein KatS3mg028_0261 [Bacteroidia bacterium]
MIGKRKKIKQRIFKTPNQKQKILQNKIGLLIYRLYYLTSEEIKNHRRRKMKYNPNIHHRRSIRFARI